MNKIAHFKNELRNLGYYKYLVKTCENNLEDLYYQLSGVKGLRYDIQPGSYNPELSEVKKLDIIEKIAKVEVTLERAKMNINAINEVLSMLSDTAREIAIEVYVNGKTFRQISTKFNYNYSGAYKALDYELRKIIKGGE